jgi:hypothetical protein
MRSFVFTPIAMAMALAACGHGPAALIQEGSGAVSQTVCSKTFISGLAFEDVMRTHLLPEPGMGFIAHGMRTHIDRAARTVDTTIYGRFASRAVYADHRGCTLAYPGLPPPHALTRLETAAPLLGPIAGDAVVAPTDPRLRAALDAAFAEPARGAPLNTQAVVIVHRDRIVAERYAPGLTAETPLLSHSIAKSVVNALVGVLVRDGALQLEDPAPIAAWANDSRRAVTIDNLLRMNAGFGVDEGFGAGIATHIWYTEPDTAAASAQARLRDAPGESWGYCSRCFVLLSRILGDRIGGGPQGVDDFARRELFGPLGMTSVEVEYDAAGTLMGANAMYATPRDWARFGLLYLHDGAIGDVRILPEGWVARSTTPTGESAYGAGFWLNRSGGAAMQEGRRLDGAPADAFMARGYMGQYIVIVPSADLVIVRMGQSHARHHDIDSVAALTRDVIAALDAP